MIYLFDDCSLDVDRRELRRGGRLVPVEPQVFDLLAHLIRNRERVVSRDELLETVWSGRIVSESTISSRIAAARRAIGDRGEDQRLLRTLNRKGFRFTENVETASPCCAKEAQASSSPERPSIAILPFMTASGHPGQSIIGHGLIEDITEVLARFRWLTVVDCGSITAETCGPVDVKHVGNRFGVRYLLKGSIRTVEERVRVTVHLIDTDTGVHLWAHRFDDAVGNMLDFEDAITAAVAGSIIPKLEQSEIERAKRTKTDCLDCYQYYLRGMGCVYQWTKKGISDALELFNRAVELDSEFGSAYGMAAYCYVQRKSYGWITDRKRENSECERLARGAADFGRDDAVALTKAGHAIASVAGDIDSGAVFIDQALLLNPNLASAWYVSGWIRLFLGDPETAIEHLARAMRLSPLDPLAFKMHAAAGYAHFFAGRYDEASLAAERALRTRPYYLTGLRGAAASHALAGRIDKARTLMADMCRFDPMLHISSLSDLIPLNRSQDFERWAEALQKAGLPD